MNKKVIKGIRTAGIVLCLCAACLLLVPFLWPVRIKGVFHPYEYTVYGTYVEITRYTGDAEEVKIPSRLFIRPVKELGTSYKNAFQGKAPFQGNEKVTSVYLPDSIERMGTFCFFECTNLQRIRLPKNLTEIPDKTFTACESLGSIHIPEGVRRIGWGAFGRCESLEEISIPEAVKVIDMNAFFGCTSLEDIELGENVEEIGEDAFGRTKFSARWTEEFVIMGNQVLVAYRGDGEIVEVPEGVTFISTWMFGNRQNMTRLILPESVKKCEGILRDCENLQYVVIKNPQMEFPEDEDFLWECPNAALVGEKGSTAEAYAKEYGIPFLEEIPE